MKSNFAGMGAVEALNHPDLPEANEIADNYRLAVEGTKFEESAYRLSYLFYSGVEWGQLTDYEREAFIEWQNSL